MESFLKSLDFHLIPQFDLDYSNWSEVNWFTSRAMSSMWGNFAKMGDPTPPGWSWLLRFLNLLFGSNIHVIRGTRLKVMACYLLL